MYNKLFSKILDSSIWLEKNPTRIVWFTFLASMDEDGFCCFASPRNVAVRAIVSVEEALEAIAILEAPDPDSSDPEHSGRRIERVPGGWMVLNSKKYHDIAKREHMKEQTRLRVAKHRSNHPVTPCNDDVQKSTPSDTDTDTDTLREGMPEKVAAIFHTHPANAHIPEGSPVPYQQETAILEAILRDGDELVLLGTRDLRDAVAKWAPADRRFIPNPVKFFTESEYRKDPQTWERRNGKQTNHEQRREELARRVAESDD